MQMTIHWVIKWKQVQFAFGGPLFYKVKNSNCYLITLPSFPEVQSTLPGNIVLLRSFPGITSDAVNYCFQPQPSTVALEPPDFWPSGSERTDHCKKHQNKSVYNPVVIQ